jgi:hypothetical protein
MVKTNKSSALIPIGVLYRKKAKKEATKSPASSLFSLSGVSDLDRRISELENNESDSDSDSDSNSARNDSLKSDKVPEKLSSLTNPDMLIPSLPVTQLPAAMCGKRSFSNEKKGGIKKPKKTKIKWADDDGGDSLDKDDKKRELHSSSSFPSSLPSSSSSSSLEHKMTGSGLESIVSELLNYKPSSSERRPFWCRVCRFQGNSQEDLLAHRGTDIHRIATEKERKLSYCKICKKQFTSPDQLEGHLKGKQHSERLAYLKAKRSR